MTARAPTFFTRLAPSAAISPFAVRAALPARYASDGAASRIDEQAETVADPRLAPPRMDAPVPAPTVRADGAVPALPEGAADFADAAQAEQPPFAARRQEVPAPAVSFKSQGGAEARPAAVDPVRIPLARPLTEAAPQVATDGAYRTPPESVARPPNLQFEPARDPPGPLKAGTVMERALETRRLEPDVVQVNIDRIDIRMPPKAGHTDSPSEPRRRAAPTISLSDYLRGADSTPRRRG